jgi:hypothetical protein
MTKFRDFESAREFVQKLGLKNNKEWKKYCNSGNKPDDIPPNPNIIYKNKGWSNVYNWIGYGKKKWRDFESARKFVRKLKLKSKTEWQEYCKSGNKPIDIPSGPNGSYKNEFKGIGDWLGSGNVKPSDYLSFEDARKFVRKLGLKGTPDWDAYCTSGNKPKNIPLAPDQSYKNKGFISMRNWVGNEWRDFKEAREFIISLNLKGQKEWFEYCKSGNKPDDIPSFPRTVYKNDFKGLGNWLGSGWRDFKEAREFARALNLKGQVKWKEYCASGNKPDDIPASPNSAYGTLGWIGSGDWLGNEKTV